MVNPMRAGQQGGFATSSRVMVWMGAKPTDAEPLVRHGLLAGVISVLESSRVLAHEIPGVSAERLLGRRPDYDRESFDELADVLVGPVAELLRGIAGGETVTIVPFSGYRLAHELASRLPTVEVAANDPALLSCLDRKPWVESLLRRMDVPCLRWWPLRDRDVEATDFPVVVRPAVGTGGQGMRLIRDRAELVAYMSGFAPAAVSAYWSSYLDSAVPVNVTGCVRADGTVSTHPASVQIIGQASCTDRDFGYCGNDFGRLRDVIEDAHLDVIDRLVGRVGGWLYGLGFRGAFGLDLLIANESVLVSELNPRFQASSHLGARLMAELGMRDVYGEHLAACAGTFPTDRPNPLRAVMAGIRPISQIFCYRTARRGCAESGPVAASPVLSHELTPAPGVVIDDHALLFRMTSDAAVLDDGGRQILPGIVTRVCALRDAVLSTNAPAIRLPSAAFGHDVSGDDDLVDVGCGSLGVKQPDHGVPDR